MSEDFSPSSHNHRLSLRDRDPSYEVMQEWTTEQLTRQHVDRLQTAWQATHDALQREKQSSSYWEEEAQRLMRKCRQYEILEKIHDCKLSLSNRHSLSPENPFALLQEVVHLRELPTIQGKELELSCLVRCGDTWVALSSGAICEEELVFSSSALDDLLSFQATETRKSLSLTSSSSSSSFSSLVNRSEGEADMGFAALQPLQRILPAAVVAYITTGCIPSLTAEKVVFGSDEQSSESRDYRNVEGKNAILVRTSISAANRCVFVLTVNERESSGANPTPNSTDMDFDAFSYSLHDALIDNTNDLKLESSLWRELLQHTNSLIVSALVRLFEKRVFEKTLLRQSLHANLLPSITDTHEGGEKDKVGVEEIDDRLFSLTRDCAALIREEVGRREETLSESLSTLSLPLSPSFLASLFNARVDCSLFFTCSSFKEKRTNTIPFISLSGCAQNGDTRRRKIFLCKASLESRDEEVLQQALLQALNTRRPQCKAYSCLSSSDSSRKDHPTKTCLEHRILLAIPLNGISPTNSAEDPFGCMVLEISSLSSMEDWQSFQKLFSAPGSSLFSPSVTSSLQSSLSFSFSSPLPFFVLAQSFIHSFCANLPSVLSDPLRLFLFKGNYYPLSVFPGSPGMVCTKREDVQLIRAAIEHIFAWHRERHTGRCDLSLKDEDLSSASNLLSGSLSRWLESDWTIVFSISEENESSTRYVSASALSLSGESYSWDNLSGPMQEMIADCLQCAWAERDSKRYQSARELFSKRIDDAVVVQLNSPPQDLLNKDIIALNAPQANKESSIEFPATLLTEFCSTQTLLFHGLSPSLSHSTHSLLVICGRLWRGKYPLFSPNAEPVRRILQLGRSVCSNLVMQEEKREHLKKEKEESLRSSLEQRVNLFLQERVQRRRFVEREQSVGEFRKETALKLKEFVTDIARSCINIALIDADQHLQEKDFDEIILNAELVLKSQNSPEEWILDEEQDWCFSSIPSEGREDNMRRETRKHDASKNREEMTFFEDISMFEDDFNNIFTKQPEPEEDSQNEHPGILTLVLRVHYLSHFSLIRSLVAPSNSSSSLIGGRCSLESVDFLTRSPLFSSWKLSLSQYLLMHKSALLDCSVSAPLSSALSAAVCASSLKVFQQLSHNALADTALQTTTSQSASSLHLHEYLHHPKLLQGLTNSPASFSSTPSPVISLEDFFVLPIRERASQDEENGEEEEFEVVLERDFVHVLSCLKRELDEESEHTVALPRVLSRVISAVHKEIDLKLHGEESSYSLEERSAQVGISAFPSQRRSLAAEQAVLSSCLHSSHRRMTDQSALVYLPGIEHECIEHILDVDAHHCGVELHGEADDGEFFDDDIVFHANSRSPRASSKANLLNADNCRVFLYSPLYALSESLRGVCTVSAPWATHYLLVSKRDRLLTPQKISLCQTLLEEVFAASQSIAAAHSWFDCLSGIERLLINRSAADRPHGLEQDNVVGNNKASLVAFRQSATTATDSLSDGKKTISESLSVLKRLLGGRYIASVGYLLRADTESMSMNELEPSKDSERIELIRCCSDARVGRDMSIGELGPPSLSLPAESSSLVEKLNEHQLVTQEDISHNFVHLRHLFTSNKGGINVSQRAKANDVTHHPRQTGRMSADNSRLPHIHYLDMSTAQLNEWLLSLSKGHKVYPRNALHSGLVDGSSLLLRKDVRVWQIFICAPAPQGEDDRIVASFIVFISSASLSLSPALTENNREATREEERVGRSRSRSRSRSRAQGERSRSRSRSSSRSLSIVRHGATNLPPHTVSVQDMLCPGTRKAITRVVDIAGSLLSSLFHHQTNEKIMKSEVARDLGEMQRERDSLYHILSAVNDSLRASEIHALEDLSLSPALSLREDENILHRVSDTLRERLAASQQLSLSAELIQRKHTDLQRDYESEKNERERLSNEFVSYVHCVETLCEGAADTHVSLTSIDETDLTADKVVSSLSHCLGLSLVARRAVSILSELGCAAEIAHSAGNIANALFAVERSQSPLLTHTITDNEFDECEDERSASPFDIDAKSTDLRTILADAHSKSPSQLSTNDVDFSVVWCVDFKEENENSQSKSFPFVESSALFPSLCARSVRTSETVVAEGNALVYPPWSPHTVRYAENLAQRGLCVERVVYLPVFAARALNEHARHASTPGAVVQIVICSQLTTATQVLQSNATSFLTSIVQSVLNAHAALPHNVNATEKLWAQSLQSVISCSRTQSPLSSPAASSAMSKAVDVANLSLFDNLFSTQFALSLAGLASLWLRSESAFAAVSDKTDVALLLKLLRRHRYGTDKSDSTKLVKTSKDKHREKWAQGKEGEQTSSNDVSSFSSLVQELIDSGKDFLSVRTELELFTTSPHNAEQENRWLIVAALPVDDSFPSSPSLSLSESPGIALFITQLARAPCPADGFALRSLLALVQGAIDQCSLSRSLARQQIETRAISVSLAKCAQKVVRLREERLALIAVWQRLTSLSSSLSSMLSPPLSATTDLISTDTPPSLSALAGELRTQNERFSVSLRSVQEWLGDEESELCASLGLRGRAKLVAIGSEDVERVQAISTRSVSVSLSRKFRDTDDDKREDPLWFENAFSLGGDNTSHRGLSVSEASMFLGSQHLNLSGDARADHERVVAALALTTKTILVDRERCCVFVPLCRERDVSRALPLSARPSLSVEDTLRETLREDDIKEEGEAPPSLSHTESWSSHWALAFTLSRKEELDQLIYLTRPLTSIPAHNESSKRKEDDNGSDESEDEESEGEVERVETQRLRRYALSSSLCAIREWLLHTRQSQCHIVSARALLCSQSLANSALCLQDHLLTIESLLLKSDSDSETEADQVERSSARDSLWRMHSVAALTGRLIHDSTRDTNNAGDTVHIESVALHWSDASSLPLCDPFSWRTARLTEIDNRLCADEDWSESPFDAKEKNLLSLLLCAQCEMFTSSALLTQRDITRCLEAEDGVIIDTFGSSDERREERLCVSISYYSSSMNLPPLLLQISLAVSPFLSHSIINNAIAELRTHMTAARKSLSRVVHMLCSRQRRMVCTALIQHRVKQIDRRQQLLALAMQLFTSEGQTVSSLLEKFQQLLGALPGIVSSELVVRDLSRTSGDPTKEKPLFEQTVNHKERAGGDDMTIRELEKVIAVNLRQDVDVLFSPMKAPPTPLSRTHNSVARSTAFPTTPTPFSPQPPTALLSPLTVRTHRERETDGPLSLSTLQSPPARSFSFFRTHPKHAHTANDKDKESGKTALSSTTTLFPKGERDGVPEMESVFECHEIRGQLVVRFVNIPQQNVFSAVAEDSITPTQILYNAEFQQVNESLLEVLTRGLARRVFELHRGALNKKLMSMKKQELSLKSRELAEKNDQVEELAISQNMTLQELHELARESERQRLLLSAEQQQLKTSLQQKKDMNAHLRQSLVEFRRESEKKEVILHKQVKELRERCALLESEREKERKELNKHQNKEMMFSSTKNELSRQLTEVQKAHQEAEAVVRQLRTELSNLEARERSLSESSEVKMRGLLQKTKLLEDELIAARGNQQFLKKQLDAAQQSLKLAHEESARQMLTMQATLLNNSPLNSGSKSMQTRQNSK